MIDVDTIPDLLDGSSDEDLRTLAQAINNEIVNRQGRPNALIAYALRSALERLGSAADEGDGDLIKFIITHQKDLLDAGEACNLLDPPTGESTAEEDIDGDFPFEGVTASKSAHKVLEAIWNQISQRRPFKFDFPKMLEDAEEQFNEMFQAIANAIDTGTT